MVGIVEKKNKEAGRVFEKHRPAQPEPIGN